VSEREFIAWDGEGVRQFICHPSGLIEPDHPFTLFGASTGERIKYVNLSSIDCLELILEVERKHPKAIHVSFAFGYDTNMIIKDLPFRQLVLLKQKGSCHWKGYNLEYIPKKWFKVSVKGVSAKIFDVFLFFNCPFGKAIRKYKIGTEEELDRIDKGKEERPHFSWLDIDEIEKYWETELRHLVSLMQNLRTILYGANLRISSWHGPGALASYALDKNNTGLYMDRGIPAEVNTAAQYAMFGGRFQPFLAGYYEGPVYDRDINSAYAYAFAKLPSLSGGKWIHTDYPDREDAKSRRMGIYRLRRRAQFSNRAMPLPHRNKGNSVCYPPVVEGWYHAPEAALLCNDPATDFIEAWIFEDDGTYPFKWVEEMYHERLLLQQRDDPTEKGLKWTLAALYGQAAQRTGWERTKGPPKWHQLEWAGAVTSECRAMVYAGAMQAKSALVSIDTDGFISLAPVNTLPNNCGDGLGQWKATEFSGILYLQNGIYWLRDQDGLWQPPKSRGIPRKKLSFEQVLPLIRKNENLKVSQHMFIGFGLALQQDILKWRKWVDIERTITFGGNGKASHNVRMCPQCQQGIGWGEAMHPLMQIVPLDPVSHPHKLPWLTDVIEDEKTLLKRWGIYD
jgi:hypothetical protein